MIKIVALFLIFSISNISHSLNLDTLYVGVGFKRQCSLGMSKKELLQNGVYYSKFYFIRMKFWNFKRFHVVKYRKSVRKKGYTKHCWELNGKRIYGYFDNNKLTGLLVKDNSVVLESGIKVGDSYDKIVEIYGKHPEIKLREIRYDQGITFYLDACNNIEKFLIHRKSEYVNFFNIQIE